jgi:hypothetical protein
MHGCDSIATQACRCIDRDTQFCTSPAGSTSQLSNPMRRLTLLFHKKDRSLDQGHMHTEPLPPNPQVYVLWPDNSTWYLAEVVSIRVRALRASLHYPETVEEEDADLAELIGEGQVAFSELGEGGGCTWGSVGGWVDKGVHYS